MMKILCIGLGSIGGLVANQLSALGHDVFGISRSQKKHLSTKVKQFNVDIVADEFQQVAESLQNTGNNFLTAFDCIIVTLTPSDYSESGYKQGYYATAERICSVFAKTQPQAKLIFISSTSVFAENAGERCDETTPVLPSNNKARYIFEAEQVYQQAFENTCVIRPSGIYGKNRLRLVKMVKAQETVKPRHWSNRIFDEDLVNIIVQIAIAGQVEPLYIATDNQPVFQEEVLDFLADRMQLPRLIRSEAQQEQTGKQIKSLYLKPEWLTYPNWQIGYEAILDSL